MPRTGPTQVARAGCALAGALLCCTWIRAGAADAPPVPKAGEGLVAVAVVNDAWAIDVRIDRKGSLLPGGILGNLHAGRNFRLLALPAGEYRWSNADLGRPRAPTYYLDLGDDVRFDFSVRPGVINYVGDLDFAPGAGLSVLTWTTDRAVQAMRDLDAQYPGLRMRYPWRVQGNAPDDFPALLNSVVGAASLVDLERRADQAVAADVAQPLDPGVTQLVDELFARPDVRLVQMNPSGTLLSFAEKRDGKYIVEVVDLASGDTFELDRSDVEVAQMVWCADRALLVGYDFADGQRNWILRLPDGDLRKARGKGVAVPGSGWVVSGLPDDPGHVLFGRIGDDGRAHVYRLDIGGRDIDPSQFQPAWRLDAGLPPLLAVAADRQGRLRAAVVLEDRRHVLMMRAQPDGPWRPVLDIASQERFGLISVDDAGDVIALTDHQRPEVDLVRIHPADGRLETVLSIPGIDLEDAILRSTDGTLLGATYVRGGVPQAVYLDGAEDSLAKRLAGLFPRSAVYVLDRSRDQRYALVVIASETRPGSYYLFDAMQHRLEKLLDRVPAPAHARLVSSQVFAVPVAGGAPIEAYLTLPPAGPPPYPLLVLPHGGPFGVHDALDYDPEVQFFANRGFAVLRVNYRGSGGRGRSFEQAGFGQWGGQIEDDVMAALDEALRRFPLDRERIAMVGASYGGYSSLVSLIRFPQRFRCGVAISAVTDVPLLFNSSDWSSTPDDIGFMKKAVGDPEAAQDELRRISPDYGYAGLQRPLLLIHGTADPRVSFEHALRLRLMLAQAGRPPQWLAIEGGDHNLAEPKQNLAVYAASDRFLQGCLRSDAAADARTGATAVAPQGTGGTAPRP